MHRCLRGIYQDKVAFAPIRCIEVIKSGKRHFSPIGMGVLKRLGTTRNFNGQIVAFFTEEKYFLQVEFAGKFLGYRAVGFELFVMGGEVRAVFKHRKDVEAVDSSNQGKVNVVTDDSLDFDWIGPRERVGEVFVKL